MGAVRRGDRPVVFRPAAWAHGGAQLAAAPARRMARLRAGVGELLPGLGGRRAPAPGRGHRRRARRKVRPAVPRHRAVVLRRPGWRQRGRRAGRDRLRGDPAGARRLRRPSPRLAHSKAGPGPRGPRVRPRGPTGYGPGPTGTAWAPRVRLRPTDTAWAHGYGPWHPRNASAAGQAGPGKTRAGLPPQRGRPPKRDWHAKTLGSRRDPPATSATQHPPARPRRTLSRGFSAGNSVISGTQVAKLSESPVRSILAGLRARHARFRMPWLAAGPQRWPRAARRHDPRGDIRLTITPAPAQDVSRVLAAPPVDDLRGHLEVRAVLAPVLDQR